MQYSPTSLPGSSQDRTRLARIRPGTWLLLIGLLILGTPATAASFEFLAIERIFGNLPSDSNIHPYAIVIASSRRRFNALSQDSRALSAESLVYQTRVRVQGQIYFRLALGNFVTVEQARKELRRLQHTFPDAWIYRRSPGEERQLARILEDSAVVDEVTPAPAAVPIASGETSAAQLLERARQEFIDGDYARVIAITDKVAETGNLSEVREALELAGITRERQGKFSQAVVLYEALLDTQPEPETYSRIERRLESIRTMSLAPKKRITEDSGRSERNPWSSRGVLQQFYQDDRVDRSEDGIDSVNRVLITDLDLSVRRRTDTDKLEMRLDAGLVNDFLDDSTESRIYIASLEYGRDSFRLVGGRQRRTMSGIYGSFDGVSFTAIPHSAYQFALAYGYQVQSSFDNFDTDQPLLGVNLNVVPYAWLDMSFYLVQQEISGMTDRQSVGSELRYLGDNAFVYGFIDYDLYFEELNNLSLTSNLQLNANWALNLSLTDGYSPALSVLSALQGQSVTSLDELRDLFSDEEIRELARDRSSKSRNLFISSSYRLDAHRYLYVHLSALQLEATEASAGVEQTPSSEDLQLALDYSFRGLLSDRDYATVGARISDSTSGEILSLRARTRLGNVRGVSYDPRLQVDFRRNDRDGVEQTIMKPAMKVTYRNSERLSFEGIFAIEYSDLNLPELEEQFTYSFYLGYYYFLF